MFKILADENVHVEIVDCLRNQGYKIETVPECGLAGHKDYEVLEYAQKQDWILLTGDKDFGGLLEFGVLYGRGKVILLRYMIMDIEMISKEIGELLKKEKELFRRQKSLLVVLSEGRYRIHYFDKS